MIGGDDPAAVGLALDTAHGAPHRLEPADMGFGERLAGMGIVAEMGVDIVAPRMGGRDLGYGAIGLADLHRARRNPDDRIDRDRIHGLARFAYA